MKIDENEEDFSTACSTEILNKCAIDPLEVINELSKATTWVGQPNHLTTRHRYLLITVYFEKAVIETHEIGRWLS